MADLIRPPIPSGGGGGILFLAKIIKWLKNLFKRPKPDESPQDMADRAQQQAAICNQINETARKVELEAVEQVKQYARFFEDLYKTEDYLCMKEYRIDPRSAMRQADLLTRQIPGMIASEVSCHLNDSDPNYRRVMWMLPGLEKESAIRSFMEQTIRKATEKSAAYIESVMDTIQDDFLDLMQEAADRGQRTLEDKEKELHSLSSAGANKEEKERIRQQAETVCLCCNLVDELLGNSTDCKTAQAR